MRSRSVILASVSSLFLTAAALAVTIGPDPAIPSSLRITTFATGLDFPYGMAVLPDNSLLVATNQSSSSIFASTARVLRFVDMNADGVADGPGVPVFTGVSGPVTGMAMSGSIVVLSTNESVLLLRAGAPGDPLTQIASMQFDYGSQPWSHNTRSVAIREIPGQGGSFEVLFNIGSQGNNTASAPQVNVSGLVSAALNPDSVYRLTISDNGTSVTPASLVQIASGLRNAFGLGFHPSGDVYIAENGIDGLVDANIPLSADELNRIPAAQVGTTMVNFGFPNHYIDYATGAVVGSGGTLPLAAFLPINGIRSEGPAGLAFAPTGFPAGLNDGIFIGFHGRGFAGGVNPENAVVYYDFVAARYFHFLLPGGNGPIDSLASSGNALFLADLTTTNSFNGAGTGAIYMVTDANAAIPEPASIWLSAAGLAALGLRRYAFSRRARA